MIDIIFEVEFKFRRILILLTTRATVGKSEKCLNFIINISCPNVDHRHDIRHLSLNIVRNNKSLSEGACVRAVSSTVINFNYIRQDFSH